MPDTLVEPVRPTVTMMQDQKHKARKGCCVGAAIGVLAILVAVALAGYFFLWRYEPTARKHIPGDANLVFRLDAAEIALFAPVRKHLWPLLDEAPKGKTRKARIKEATGVNPATDLREIIVASTEASRWVILVGGNIPKERFVGGLEKVAREEGWIGWRRAGELLLGPGGIAVGQADDGTILIGTHAEVVQAALPASDEWTRLGFPEEGATSFAITRAAWDGVGGTIGGMLPRGGGGLFRRIHRATGVMTLGQTPAIRMQIEPVSGETAAAVATDMETVLGDLKLVTLVLPEFFGEKRALQSATVVTKGNGVEVRASWPYDGLESACEKLANLIRGLQGP